MSEVLSFRNGRLDASGAPGYNARNVTIQDAEVDLAMQGASRAILPPSYTAAPAAVQVVPLTSIVLDFSARMVDYNKDRLRSILSALKSGTPLPPLSVTAEASGLYTLENGYHRFLASALLGYTSIPIDKPAQVAAAPMARPAAKYVPPHLRNKK